MSQPTPEVGPRNQDERDCSECVFEQDRAPELADHLAKLEESHGLLIRNYALIIDQKNDLIQENRRLRKKLLRRSKTVIRLLNKLRGGEENLVDLS